MSNEPEAKRLKMEPHLSGDDNSQETTQVGVLASKTLLRAPTASPSGDFGTNSVHQYVTLVSGETSESTGSSSANSNDVIKQVCEFGDNWEQKYRVPLTKYPQQPVHTGNLFYDSIILDLENLGFRPLRVVSKARSSTIIVAQNLHLIGKFGEFESVPVAVKLNSGKSRRYRSGSGTEIFDESMFLKELNHPNIVIYISNIKYHGRYGVVTEFCENGTLEKLIKAQETKFLSETVARRYFIPLHSALEHIHSLGIAHRDICPQNVLISQNNSPKLCDFGHAIRFTSGDKLCEDECGSIGFQAPEIVKRIPYNPKQADIWSFGAMLYSLCTGRFPLGTIRTEIVEKAACEIKFVDDRVMPLSREFKSLTKWMLTSSPEARYSLNRIAHSEWMKCKDDRVQIGNFFRIREPRKMSEGTLESEVKRKLEI